MKLLGTVFTILKTKRTPLGNYKPKFTVKQAFVFLKTQYLDKKEKRIAAWKLDHKCKKLLYSHTLEGPTKYFEAINDKILRLEHLGILKIEGDANKITVAEHAFEKSVPAIAINTVNAKWNTWTTNTDWTHYQEFNDK